MPTCNKCLRYLALDMFHASGNIKTGIRSTCKECDYTTKKARLALPEPAARNKANFAAWYAINRESHITNCKANRRAKKQITQS